mgnify:FL=1
MMLSKTMKLAALGFLLAPLCGLGVACAPEGPAEKAGKSVDNAVQDAKDAVNPPGPVEKAGRAVDDAVENAKDAIDPPGPAEKAGREVDKAVNP